MFELSPEGLATLAGIVLSAVFAYFPWVSKWYEGLASEVKPLLNAFVLLLVAWGYLAIQCDFNLDCMAANASVLFKVWFYAIMASIGTYVTAVRQFKKKAWLAK